VLDRRNRRLPSVYLKRVARGLICRRLRKARFRKDATQREARLPKRASEESTDHRSVDRTQRNAHLNVKAETLRPSKRYPADAFRGASTDKGCPLRRSTPSRTN
jgi:hypothetical protein